MVSVVDVHVYNDKRLMTNFKQNPTKVAGSISNNISPGIEKIKIRLALNHSIKRLVLTLINVFYLSHNPLNLVSLDLLNNARIFYHNTDQTLYNQEIQTTLAFSKHYNINFLLHFLNLSVAATSLLKNNNI